MSSSTKKPILIEKYYKDDNRIEIGVDEAGRGPMFGRVYAAAVVLPKDDSFKHEDMKDSKKFSSEKKINKTADYIKKNATAWAVAYMCETEIDKINIRNATHQAMHKAIKEVISKLNLNYTNTHILIDGKDFTPYIFFENDTLISAQCTTITQGDNKLTSIAAASILAKVERDKYIIDLCDKEPDLDEKYRLKKNKGYGTKEHMQGIEKWGISKYHRQTFGICKN
jgi:ribonuclease HII